MFFIYLYKEESTSKILILCTNVSTLYVVYVAISVWSKLLNLIIGHTFSDCACVWTQVFPSGTAEYNATLFIIPWICHPTFFLGIAHTTWPHMI